MPATIPLAYGRSSLTKHDLGSQMVYVVRCPLLKPRFDDLEQENIPHAASQLEYVNYYAFLNPSSAVQHHFPLTPPRLPRRRSQMKVVTLNEPDVASNLLSRFPYDGDNTRLATDDGDYSSAEESEARKAGFRTLLNGRWDTLQAEYAEYRESLLRCIAAVASSTEPAPNKIKSTHDPPEELERAPTANLPQTQSYPSGCVLFARHVPP
ncbi:hypothetical protein EDB84DRAFT_1568695 [Lactarius hengduanensis]|nr:hypothetical protein EDB84DRAFT_1568695 [Lactarius hengduanensis]